MFIVYGYEDFGCMCIYHVNVGSFGARREGMGTRIKDGYDLPREYWEPNLGPLQENLSHFCNPSDWLKRKRLKPN